MILKMNNQDKDFYKYMGPIFGSRKVEAETRDRIYDDDNKIWYLYTNQKSKKVLSLVSVSTNVIKNVYTTDEKYLIELLKEVQQDISIKSSVVPIVYKDIYKEIGLTVTEINGYKNYISVRGDDDE